MLRKVIPAGEFSVIRRSTTGIVNTTILIKVLVATSDRELSQFSELTSLRSYAKWRNFNVHLLFET